MSPVAPDPPAAPWLNKYLALIIFLTSIVSASLGMLIAGTLAVSDVNHTMTEHGKLLGKLEKQQEVCRVDMVNVDRRLNEGAANLSTSERQQDHALAELAQKIAVLEAQLKLFAGRTVAPQPMGLP